MRIRTLPAATLGVVAALAAFACGGSEGGAPGGSTELARADSTRAAVLATARGFREALAAGDSAAALAHLHPEVRIYEGGHAEDLEAYRGGHLGADMRFLGRMRVETLEERVVPGGELSLYLASHRMTGEVGGDTLRLIGAETFVMQPVDGAWEIRHVHWSSREAPRP